MCLLSGGYCNKFVYGFKKRACQDCLFYKVFEKMKCEDFKNIDIESELFLKTDRLLLYGGSHSGKSFFLQKLVLRHHEKFGKIIICGTPNELLNYPETKYKTKLYEDIYDPFKNIDGDDVDDDGDGGVKEKKDDRQTLIILDDLMSTAYNSPVVNNMFLRGRHLNISVILVLQTFFPQGTGKSLLPQIKNSATVQIFFRLRNQAEMSLAAKKLEFDKKSQEFFLDLIKKKVTNKRFGYIAVFMDEISPEAKYRSNLIFEDGSKFETVYTR